MVGVILILLWFGVVFDPVGSFFSLNKILLAPIFMLYLIDGLRLKTTSSDRKLAVVFVIVSMSIFLVLYGLIVAQIRGGLRQEFIDTSYIASAIYLMVTITYLRPSNLKWSMNGMVLSLNCLSLLVIYTYFAYWNGYTLDLLYFLVEKGVLYLGVREYAGFEIPYVYYIASPVISIVACKAVSDYLKEGSFFCLIQAIIPTAALCLTGVRTAQICGFVILGVVLFHKNKKIFTAALFFATLIIGVEATQVVFAMFDSTDHSNATKLEYLPVYGEMFADAVTFLFGQGFNAHTWNAEFSSLITTDGASKVELTYLELLRVYGVIFGVILLLIGLILPLGYLKSNEREFEWLYYGMILFLFSSALNPYLFSGTGMLALGLVLGVCINSDVRTSACKL
ncbi:hypothetical protein [Chitinibacter sp. ZOR0017]|uniref:hypothetical protein n=1 Tax=Chitinibacter sp. ZOR0017 TaxID=1339254 RepID=UPI0006454F82|nr:hypothetical protein [Chitinibacter sp. ZOR0017]